MDRFLAEGAVYRELRDLQQRITRYEDWRNAWAELGRATEERAQQLLESDCTQTAASDLWRSSIYYFFAQFLLWDDAAAKRATYADCARVFRKASIDLPLYFESVRR